MKRDAKTFVSRLSKRVTVLRKTDEKDSFGQPLDEYLPVCTIWAAVEPLQGREFFSAMQENAEVTTRIRIRYREGIDRTMIVRHGDIDFEILYIIHPELNKRELQLMCKERQ
jgi:SPP1 family predicted phage head-tail adaptor